MRNTIVRHDFAMTAAILPLGPLPYREARQGPPVNEESDPSLPWPKRNRLSHARRCRPCEPNWPPASISSPRHSARPRWRPAQPIACTRSSANLPQPKTSLPSFALLITKSSANGSRAVLKMRARNRRPRRWRPKRSLRSWPADGAAARLALPLAERVHRVAVERLTALGEARQDAGFRAARERAPASRTARIGPDRGSQVRRRLAAGGSRIRTLGPPRGKLRYETAS
jgi:hypothetical protein